MIKNTYSVAQVNSYIKNMFSQDFLLKKISVKAEVSNCKYHSSGHIYFTLKDASGTLSAVMFAGKRDGLRFQMKEGDKVIVTGSVQVFERDGKYQLYAQTIELDGEGDLFVRFEALKKELEEMGMFAPEYKRPIPKYARKVGVVTAPTGAAVQDIRNISRRRNPYVQLILYPAIVQGDEAPQSIVNGIHALEHCGVDVIIVGRGGGSIEDLWAFNEEIVARAIFDCTIPIISAVGHETDFTIADFVSDLRAPTPSAAAELAVFDVSLVENRLNQYQNTMTRVMTMRIQQYRERLSHKITKLGYLSPRQKLLENKKKLQEQRDKISRLMQKVYDNKKHSFDILVQQLEGVSPIRKLSQGYALVEDSKQRVLTSVSQVEMDDEVKIHVMDGEIKAKVAEVKYIERK